MKELIDLERQGWEALSSVGEAGKDFYAAMLREDAVMLFPGGMRTEGRERILQSLGIQPWETFQIENPRVIALTENVATVVYKVTARRQRLQPYIALISSTYVRNEGWKLVVHQQTPV